MMLLSHRYRILLLVVVRCFRVSTTPVVFRCQGIENEAQICEQESRVFSKSHKIRKTNTGRLHRSLCCLGIYRAAQNTGNGDHFKKLVLL